MNGREVKSRNGNRTIEETLYDSAAKEYAQISYLYNKNHGDGKSSIIVKGGKKNK